MSPEADFIDDGLRDREYHQGNPTFVYRGRHWPCSGGLISSGLDTILGGKKQEMRAVITIRKSAIPVRVADNNEMPTSDSDSETADEDVMPPHTGKLCMFKNKLFRIGECIADTDAAWKYELVTPTMR